MQFAQSVGRTSWLCFALLACDKSQLSVGDLGDTAGNAGAEAGSSGVAPAGGAATAGEGGVSVGEGGTAGAPRVNEGGAAGLTTPEEGGAAGAISPEQGGAAGALSNGGGTAGVAINAGAAGIATPEQGGAAGSHPLDIASRQTVTFRVTNDGQSELFVPTDGFDCDLFRMTALDQETGGTSLELGFKGVPDACGQCDTLECDYPTPHASVFTPTPAGGTQAYTWDARALVTWSELGECGGPSTQTYEDLAGASQPVSPGRYQVTVGYRDVPPEDCTLTETGAYHCTTGWGGYSGFKGLCQTSLTASVEFELPAQGDIEVVIPLQSGTGVGGAGGEGGGGGAGGATPVGGAAGLAEGGSGGTGPLAECGVAMNDLTAVAVPCDQGGEQRWFHVTETGTTPERCTLACVPPGSGGYESLIDCRQACGGYAPSYCTLAPDRGNCDGAITRWAFNAATGQCETFSHGGCEDGNDNRFETEEECMATCQGDQQCSGPQAPGVGECVDGTGCLFCSMYTGCAGGCSCVGGAFQCAF